MFLILEKSYTKGVTMRVRDLNIAVMIRLVNDCVKSMGDGEGLVYIKRYTIQLLLTSSFIYFFEFGYS